MFTPAATMTTSAVTSHADGVCGCFCAGLRHAVATGDGVGMAQAWAMARQDHSDGPTAACECAGACWGSQHIAGAPGGICEAVASNLLSAATGGGGVTIEEVLDYIEAHDLTTTDVATTRSGAIVKEDGQVVQVVKTGGRTLTFNRDASGVLQSISDGTRTRTFIRDDNGTITGWTVE